MTIADRATRALDLARTADPDHASREDNGDIRRFRAQLARNLAATLGVDAGLVVATADPNRVYGGRPGHLLTVTDDETVYRFVPASVNWDNAFCLLGPCPACGADVPVSEVAQLADLGHYLVAGPSPAHLDDHRSDRNHLPTCTHAATD